MSPRRAGVARHVRLGLMAPAPEVPARARQKIARRILPFVFVLYIIAYLDRANVAFANVPMRADLGFSEEVFGFGGGIFFLGYFLLEIPGALIVERWSARRWMARILVTWGLCTVLVSAVRTPAQFYGARFLLGAAEAGFFPGIIVYLTHWFSAADRTRAMAGFMIAAPVSLALGAPLSAIILKLTLFGLPGWRWMLILEGIPAVVFGVIALFYMTDHPHQAKWLRQDEREWISGALEAEKLHKRRAIGFPWWQALRQRNVLLLTAAHFFANLAGYGFVLWLPNTLQKILSLSNTASTLLSALPFLAAVTASLFTARSSDRTGERKRHACTAFLCAASFLALAAIPNQPLVTSLIWLTLTGAAAYAWIAPFWVLPTIHLGESAAAASIGMINSVGNLGGFVGPWVVGYLLARRLPYGMTMMALSLAYVASATLTAMVSVGERQRTGKE